MVRSDKILPFHHTWLEIRIYFHACKKYENVGLRLILEERVILFLFVFEQPLQDVVFLVIGKI